ncbi:MAG: gliding motility-associated C-terminal domain-containing protein [Flavobacteriales bacterium]|nr:gliding motility-associated C-terminal domain-containing protein [Flavobacteriales bacterium]
MHRPFLRCSLTLLLVSAVSGIHAQSLVWAGQLEGSGSASINDPFPGESLCTDMTVDDVGNIYVAGNCNDTIDFDPSASDSKLHGQYVDLFFAKYSGSGELVWAKLLQGLAPQWNRIAGIELDPTGNIVVVGSCTGSMDMDPGPGSFPLDLDANVNFTFIAKYDPEGDLLWAKHFGASFAVIPTGMDVTDMGEVLLTGSFYLSVDADPGPNVDLLTSPAHAQYFSKFDPNGNLLWAKAIVAIGQYGGPLSITSVGGGAVLLSGTFSGTVDFDPSANLVQMTAPAITTDEFVAKYDAAGTFIWAKRLHVLENPYGLHTLEMEEDVDGSFVVLGSYLGSYADVDPGPGVVLLPPTGDQNSAYLARFSFDGDLIWAKGLVGFTAPSQLALGACGRIYVAGSSYSADMDPGPDVALLESPALSAFADAWAMYDADGNYIWARTVGNNGYGGSTFWPALAVYGDQHYLAGGFKQIADFDPGPGSTSFTATGNGSNGYIARFDVPSTALELGNDTSICEGTTLVLDPHAEGLALVWQDGTTGPLFTVTDEGLYWVASNIGTCSFSDSIHIAVEDCSLAVEMPNVFSPNGDGENDHFVPIRASGVIEARLDVFNRWGRTVHSTSDLSVGWNGKLDGQTASEGVYFWTLCWTFRGQQDLQHLSGEVTLLR